MMGNFLGIVGSGIADQQWTEVGQVLQVGDSVLDVLHGGGIQNAGCVVAELHGKLFEAERAVWSSPVREDLLDEFATVDGAHAQHRRELVWEDRVAFGIRHDCDPGHECA